MYVVSSQIIAPRWLAQATEVGNNQSSVAIDVDVSRGCLLIGLNMVWFEPTGHQHDRRALPCHSCVRGYLTSMDTDLQT